MRKIVKVRPVFVNFSSSFRPNAQCGNVLQNRKFLSFHLVFFYTFALKKMIINGLWTKTGRKKLHFHVVSEEKLSAGTSARSPSHPTADKTKTSPLLPIAYYLLPIFHRFLPPNMFKDKLINVSFVVGTANIFAVIESIFHTLYWATAAANW